MEDASTEAALAFVDNALSSMNEALAGADVSTIASETLSSVAALNTIQNDTLTSNKINLTSNKINLHASTNMSPSYNIL